MSDILNELSKYVNEQFDGTTPVQFMNHIDKIMTQLDEIEDFAQRNVHIKEFKDVILRYSQAMRESAVLSAEVFQEYSNEVERKKNEEPFLF